MNDTDQSTVTIEMPEQPQTEAGSIWETQKTESLEQPSAPISEKPAENITITPEPLIVESNQEEKVLEEKPKEELSPSNPPIVDKIIRNEKGQIVKPIPQDTNKNGTAGRPCKYCENKETNQKIVDDYVKLHQESVKLTIPWIEEIALKLNVGDNTFINWVNKENEGVLEHPELVSSYSILKALQKLRLKQRALGRFNPHGALYLLNADHKVIQTNKNVLANDEKGPLEIIITEEKKSVE